MRVHDVTGSIRQALGPGSTPPRCGARPRTYEPRCSSGSDSEVGHASSRIISLTEIAGAKREMEGE